MTSIIIHRAQFNGDNPFVNGKERVLPRDVPFDADDTLLTLLDRAGVPWELAPGTGALTGNVIIRKPSPWGEFVPITLNGKTKRLPAGVALLLSSSELSLLVAAAVPFIYEREREGGTPTPTPAPAWTVQPSISPSDGPWRIGDTLTGADGTVSNGTVSARQWLRGASAISGATGSTYALGEGDLGADIAFRPTATGPGGSASATSAAIGPVTAGEPSVTVATVIYDTDAEQFVVTNAEEFPDATWAWEDEDETAISGQTASTLARADAPVGKYVRAIANGDPATASNWAIAPVNRTVLDETFDGVDDNTMVDGWNGWNAYVNWSGAAIADDPGAKVIDDSVYLASGSGDSSARWMKSLSGGQHKKITVFNPWNADGSNNNLKSSRGFYLGWKPNTRQNHIRFFSLNTGIQSTFTASGSTTSQTNQAGTISVATTSYGFSWDGSVVRTYVNGSETAASASANGFATTGLSSLDDVTLSFDLPVANFDAGGAPWRMFDRILVEDLPATNWSLDDMSNEGLEITVSLTYSGDADAFDWALADAEGRIVLDWTLAEEITTPGEAEVTFALPEAYAGRPGMQLFIRPDGDGAEMDIVALNQMPFEVAVDPLVMGVQSGGLSSSAPADLTRDRGYAVSWRYQDSVSGRHNYVPLGEKTADGWPAVEPSATSVTTDQDGVPTSFDTLVAVIFEGGDNHIGTRQGTWNCTTNAASTISKWTTVNTDVTDITSTSFKITTGTIGQGTTCSVKFKNPTVPAEGFQLHIIREGDGAETFYTPELAAIWGADAWGGEFWWRDLKDAGVEFSKAAGPANSHLPTILSSPMAAVARFNELGQHTRHNVPWATAAYHFDDVKAWIDEFAATADPQNKLSIELDNEDWNDGYGPNREGLATYACNEGMIDGLVVPDGVEVLNGAPYVAGDTGVTSRDFEPGEWFFCKTGGYHWVVAKVIAAGTVAAGATVNTTTNADFEVVLWDDNKIPQGIRRAQAVLQARVGEYLHQKLGSRGISSLGASLTDSPSALASYLLYRDSYKHIDFYSPNFYAGKHAEYNDSANSWITQHTSNFGAFNTGFFDKLNSTWTATLSKLQTLKQDVVAILLAAGVPFTDCPMLGHLYEGGDHNTIINVPSGEVAGLLAAVRACRRSSGYGLFAQTQVSDLKTYIGGVIHYFHDVERVFYSSSGSPPQAQWFGLREFQFDGAWNDNGADEQAYAAWLAAFAEEA